MAGRVALHRHPPAPGICVERLNSCNGSIPGPGPELVRPCACGTPPPDPGVAAMGLGYRFADAWFQRRAF